MPRQPDPYEFRGKPRPPEEVKRIWRERGYEQLSFLDDEKGAPLTSNETLAEIARAKARDPEVVIARAQAARDEKLRAEVKEYLMTLSPNPPLWDALPERNLNEPILAWIDRCQVAAVNAAVSMAATTDDALQVEPSPRGWYIRHKGTGQRIEVLANRSNEGPLDPGPRPDRT